MIYKGGCHCGAVAYEVEAPDTLEVTDCNCSICSKSGYLHLIVNKEQFHLLKGEDALITYTFDTHEAKHRFCKICGIKSFYVPRSHPEGFSINARCLDQSQITSMNVTPFDGQNWEQAIEELRARKPRH